MKNLVKIFFLIVALIWAIFLLSSCGAERTYCHTYSSWTYNKNMNRR